MKKKIAYTIVIVLFIVGIILFSGKVYKLKVIEKLSSTTNKENEENITTIDVTGIEIGKETEHEHVYKTMYDEEKHWEECTICGEKRNEVNHTIKTTWTLGTESCRMSNFYTNTCFCGYSNSGHKPCVWDGKTYKNWSGYTHARICKICNEAIQHSYYLNTYQNGKLYTIEDNFRNVCSFSNGNELSCATSGKGTCNICKTNYTNVQHLLVINEDNKIVCTQCNSEFGQTTIDISTDRNAPTTYTVTMNVELKNGAIFDKIGYMRNVDGIWKTNIQTISNKSLDNISFTLTTKAEFNNSVKSGFTSYVLTFIKINGVSCRLETSLFTAYPDSIEPEILNIIIGNNEIDEWNKSKSIMISGTENWTNTVRLQILDNNENIIYTGSGNVTSGNYSISCTPELEAGLEGRTFKAIVTDACENSTEQEFTISKIDSIPPEATSNAEVGGDWAREKSFTAVCSDHGIGNVQIAFNDVSDYSLATKNGNEYARNYKLVGDVYSPTQARIFYKDELNNISSQEITIDKLDNTAPSITGSSFNNNKLAIEANDIKEGMGEGSGIAKYRFITSTTKLENPEITKENSTEVLVNKNMIIPDIVTAKYVYVVAEDLVRKYK